MRTGTATIQTRLLTILVFVLLSLAGCGSEQEHEARRPLRIGYGPWPGFDVIAYADLEGIFEARGLDVELIRLDNQLDATRALRRGRIDAGFTSVSDLLQMREQSDELEIVLVINVSNGSDGIAAGPGITSVADLAGRRVGAKRGTVNQVILLEALEKHDVPVTQVQIDDLSNSISAERLARGELDAAVLWEPELSAAASAAGGRVIHRTSDLDSLVIDVFVVPESTMRSRRDDIARFVLAWFDVMDAIDESPERVFTAVGVDLGQCPEAFAADYAGLRKGSRELNRSMIRDGALAGEVGHLRALLDSAREDRAAASAISIEPALVAEAIAVHEESP